LIEFMKMNWNIPTVQRLTVAYLVFDQMANIYYYFLMNSTMYITDVLFAETPGSVSFFPGINVSMLVPGNPEISTICFAMLYTLPMVPIHGWEYARIALDLKGVLRNFLRASCYRKYLNYTWDSRQKFGAAEMKIALECDVAEASKCYTHGVELSRVLIRVCLVVFFTLEKNPRSWWIILLMPALMACWIYCRQRVSLEVVEAECDWHLKVDEFVVMSCESYSTVAEYHARCNMIELLSEKLRDSTRHGRIPKQQVDMNNKYFSKWLGPVFVALYISTATTRVLEGSLSVGKFLATISILQGIAGHFEEFYRILMSLSVLVGPLRFVVHLLNMPIDVPAFKQTFEAHREMTIKARAQVRQPVTSCVIEDAIPLQLLNMGLTFSSGVKLLTNVSLSVPQGSLIAIMAANSVKARSTLLKLLGQVVFPTEGHVFMPTHLRVLHVSYQPQMLMTGMWLNLTLGMQDAPHERVHAILADLGMRKTLKLLENKESMEDDDLSWLGNVSATEFALIHLARGFIKSAEVTLFSRPLAHFNTPEARRPVLAMIEELVANRGVRLPAEGRHRRRPRTCFFTPETDVEADHADYIWTIEADHSISVRVGKRRRLMPLPLEKSPHRD